jgi:aryl-alcohol dehydrogenase-like predicted oxidoreductase
MDAKTESHRVQLWKDGPKIPPLGIGTWAWGDRFLWGYGRGGYTDEDLRAAFDASLAAGINFFDTAEVYGAGRSEKLLGEFIKGSGQTVIAASKCFPYPWRWRGSSLLGALQKSLDRLGIEKIDLYQMHWPFPPVRIKAWMDAMAEAVEAGLISAVGVSNYSAAQTRAAYQALRKHGVPLATNQIKYSLLHRQPESNGVLEVCKELGVKVIAYSPIGQGLLTGKYTAENPPPGARSRRTSGETLQELETFNALLASIGEHNGGKNPAQVALNWTICKDTIPIPGVKNAAQTKDNLGALGWRLSPKEVQELDDASASLAG